ncbi:helix-turn-helix domain-containing protein [Dactylosporangium sp. NPDC051541]|uniref:helix-turn-helix domain-containing protein n=1 Tax=Dactylosporangium sp. NPDC051541 TaxID=3363977 RepID=UPI0037B43375
MSDLPLSADDPVEPVGAVLARWRKRAGITGQALASRVGMSQAKISRLETGTSTAEPADVRRIAEALELPPDAIERLVEQSEQPFPEWAIPPHDNAAFQREINRIEASAKELRVFQPTVAPGLLQTSEYARAIMASVKNEMADDRLVDSEVAVSEAVNARMHRNQVLRQPGRKFHFLITEQVLHNRVCGVADMLAQINRLREVATYPNVELKIIPDNALLRIAPFHGFELVDDRWLLVDLFSSSLKSHNRAAVRPYRRIFDVLERSAVASIDDLLNQYQAHYARMLLPGATQTSRF